MQHFFLNGVVAIKPRAERRADEMLREMPKNPERQGVCPLN
jgi:hypothetical protein